MSNSTKKKTKPNEPALTEENSENSSDKIHCQECNKPIPRHLLRPEFYKIVESEAIFNLLVTGKKTGKTTTLALLHAADGVEDHAANAPAAVTKLAESAERLLFLAACEMVVAAQSIDLRGDVRLGAGTARIRDFVRSHVDRLEEDRPSGPDVSRLAEAIKAGGW